MQASPTNRLADASLIWEVGTPDKAVLFCPLKKSGGPKKSHDGAASRAYHIPQPASWRAVVDGELGVGSEVSAPRPPVDTLCADRQTALPRLDDGLPDDFDLGASLPDLPLDWDFDELPLDLNFDDLPPLDWDFGELPDLDWEVDFLAPFDLDLNDIFMDHPLTLTDLDHCAAAPGPSVRGGGGGGGGGTTWTAI